MKFLFTTSFYPPYHLGGDAVHVKYLAEALAKKGHDVHVLFSVDAYLFKKKGSFKGIENQKNLTFHALVSPIRSIEPILNYTFTTMPYTLNKFSKLVKKENFDVVHHHNISLLGESILKRRGPYVNLYTAHDYWLVCPKYNLFREGQICKEKKGCFFCCLKDRKPYPFVRFLPIFKKHLHDLDAVICPSDFMRKVISTEINNCITLYNFLKIQNRTIVKENHDRYYFFAGALEPEKGILELIKVFKKNNKKLVIAGDGPLRGEVETEAFDNISYVGWQKQEDIFSLLAGCQALIIPSVCAENFPTVALEALYYGKPVIGSNNGGIPEIIKKIDKSLVFNNLSELSKIIGSFNASEFNEEKIKRIYQENFSEKQYLKSYMNLIQRKKN
ncbi:MAG: glycosyltransferase [Nanoarchaeota archaeon]|nr:glycosyltransferase [Nanoarchaeota archaeon]